MEKKIDYKIVPEKGMTMYDISFCACEDCKTLCARNTRFFQPRERIITVSDFGPHCASYLPGEFDTK